MKTIKLILLFCLLWMLLPTNICLAQYNTLDEEEWRAQTENLEYNEEPEEPKEITPDAKSKFDFAPFAATLKYVFFFTVLGLLIFFLVRYILNLQGNAVVETEMQIEVNTLREAEQNVLKANLIKLIEQLVAEQKYREATRAYFLLVLQRLHLSGNIDWKKPKTNFDYVREVASKPFGNYFNQLTGYFEWIWYGQQPVDEVRFRQIEPEFIHLLKQLQAGEK